MPNSPLRVILDTNLWVSFLIQKDYSALSQLLFTGTIILIFSNELLSEFIEVTHRPKFKKYFTEPDISALTEVIGDYAEFVEVKTIVTICRDEKDNFLLALAKDAGADYLLTGDGDLLELNPFEKTKVVTISNFFQEVTIS